MSQLLSHNFTSPGSVKLPAHRSSPPLETALVRPHAGVPVPTPAAPELFLLSTLLGRCSDSPCSCRRPFFSRRPANFAACGRVCRRSAPPFAAGKEPLCAGGKLAYNCHSAGELELSPSYIIVADSSQAVVPPVPGRIIFFPAEAIYLKPLIGP